MEIHRKTIEDLELFEFGAPCDSPRVIFLHGGPGMYGYMRTFCEKFASHCNAVYYEQRGSKQGSRESGISDHLRDLKRIVDSYSSEPKPIIVGHSWGAMLAVLFAGSHSDLLQKVILIGCGPLNKIQGKEFQDELNSRFGDRKEYYDALWDAIGEEKDEEKQQQLVDNYVREMMEIYQMDPVSGLEIQPLHWDYKGGFKTMCESDEFVSGNEYEKALHTISSPLTIINGANDVISSESLFSLLRKHVSHVKTFEIAEAGHYPWAGRGCEEFLQILLKEVK